jgi:hypothetical protein
LVFCLGKLVEGDALGFFLSVLWVKFGRPAEEAANFLGLYWNGSVFGIRVLRLVWVLAINSALMAVFLVSLTSVFQLFRTRNRPTKP